jgi:hypothetical protein
MALTAFDRPTTALGSSSWFVSVPSPHCPNILFPQQRTVASWSSAHVCAAMPSAMAATPPLMTVTGVSLLMVVLSPTWPLLLEPQHCTARVDDTIVHVCCPPAATRSAGAIRFGGSGGGGGLTIGSEPAAATEVGTSRLVTVPSPSCPAKLAPQQAAAPVLSSAQVCCKPAVKATASANPVTLLGTSALFVMPSPSWPCVLSPQQLSCPDRSKAQVWVPPRTTAATVDDD